MRDFCDSAVILTDGDLIFYYANFYVDDGYLVIHGNEKYLLTDGRYIESAKKLSNAKCYLQMELSLKCLLEKLQVKKVGLVYDYTSAKVYDELSKLGYELFDYTAYYNKISAVKSQSQLSKIKRACEISEQAFLNTLPHIKQGITELELSAELEHKFKRLGGGVGFETIVAFGIGSSVPHYKTGDVKLTKNTPILMDFGCSYGGFLSDMTRTLYFGEPNEKFLSVYEAVKNAHLKAVSEIKSGISCKDADAISRDYLKNYNLHEYFTHSLGHGIGVKIHEYPTLNTRSSTVLEDGMVFSVEPGVYLEGEFGVRIEDTVTLKGGKAVSLMTTDKELLIIKG